jgi:FHA domain-containing protein
MGVKELFGGITEGELGQPDLLRRVTDGIAALARHAGKGTPVLPPEVEVHIKVGKGGVQVIEQFVQDPAFDREVEARVLNELVKLRPEGLPVRRYVVEPGERTSVEVKESPRRRYQLRIQGGDRDGTTITLPPNRRVYLLGRGDWHGEEQQVANDVVLSQADKAISRRAARLHRSTSGLELESLDQQQALVVERPNGEKLRPALASSGRVPLSSGDRIEFTDGSQPIVTVHFEEA